MIFSTEDGPATLDNQLYMYVGKKDRSSHASVLERNGLVDGTVYVFRSRDRPGTAKGRDGSIWRFYLVKGPTGAVGVDVGTATRVAELNPPGRDGVPVGPGVWETSGIIDTTALFGADTWLSDVQAHPPTTAPGGTTVTVEDGQLFVMRPT